MGNSRRERRKAQSVKQFNRKTFKGDWPFICDCVTVFKLFGQVVLVEIDEEIILGLNGLASMQGYENVFEAGYAEVGKSISPFIEAGLKLKPLHQSNSAVAREIYERHKIAINK